MANDDAARLHHVLDRDARAELDLVERLSVREAYGPLTASPHRTPLLDLADAFTRPARLTPEPSERSASHAHFWFDEHDRVVRRRDVLDGQGAFETAIRHDDAGTTGVTWDPADGWQPERAFFEDLEEG